MHRVAGIAIAAVSAVGLAGALLAQSGTPQAPPDKAIVTVRVPADAVVSIDGRVTNQKGPERRFVTPSLEPGTTYSLEIVARWNAMGKTQSAKRTVNFQAGQTPTVDLTRPDPPAKNIEPQKKKEPEKKKDPAPKKTPPEKKTEPPPKKTQPEKKTEPPPKKTQPEKKTEPAPKTTQPEEKTEPAPKKTPPEVKKQPEKKAAPEVKKKAQLTPPPPEVRTRSFLFTYAARIKELPRGTRARIWIPIATSNAQQEVTIVEKFLGDERIAHDPVYGNAIACFEGKENGSGVIPFEVTYKVERKEVHTDPTHGLYVPAATGEPVQRYLQPDTRVPVTGKPLDLLEQYVKSAALPSEPVTAARLMYDAVNGHVKYKPAGSAPGIGDGDADGVCVRGLGNCTDFHSLFIAMARGHHIPAKFEVGFAVPSKPGPVAGYHCWAWFCAEGKGWVPVDISKANRHPEQAAYCFGNLDEHRISFTVGRDIDLVPRQNGPPLNFFIDPYVEVNGKAYPSAKIQHRYSVKDLPASK